MVADGNSNSPSARMLKCAFAGNEIQRCPCDPGAQDGKWILNETKPSRGVSGLSFLNKPDALSFCGNGGRDSGARVNSSSPPRWRIRMSEPVLGRQCLLSRQS